MHVFVYLYCQLCNSAVADVVGNWLRSLVIANCFRLQTLVIALGLSFKTLLVKVL